MHIIEFLKFIKTFETYWGGRCDTLQPVKSQKRVRFLW